MKSFDFDAVTYKGAVYCIGCLPFGVTSDDDEACPIFADSEWDHVPVCDVCGTEHDYVTVLASTEYRAWSVVNGALAEGETFATSEERDANAFELATGLMRDGTKDWQVFAADVTAGCNVGEWADETAEVRYSG